MNQGLRWTEFCLLEVLGKNKPTSPGLKEVKWFAQAHLARKVERSLEEAEVEDAGERKVTSGLRTSVIQEGSKI